MITSARIENFKGFKNLLIPELSRITILGGRNNVGKTAMLEALYLFYDGAEMDFFFRNFTWRGIGNIPKKPEAVVAPLFRNYQMNEKIIITVAEDGHNEMMAIEFNSYHNQKSIEVSSLGNTFLTLADLEFSSPCVLTITYKSEGKDDQKYNVIVRSDRINIEAAIPWAKPVTAVFIGMRTNVDPNAVAIQFGALDIIGKQNIVVESLQTLEPRLRSLSSVTVGKISLIHGDIGIGRKIPIAFIGEGMSRLLSIILTIATNRDSLVLIDEFESGFHHSIMAKVWEGISKAASEFNCQIIATTHSYECLQAASEGVSNSGLSDDFRYVRLDRRPEDIIATTYSHKELGTAIELGWEVR